jgi:hypothetical protein
MKRGRSTASVLFSAASVSVQQTGGCVADEDSVGRGDAGSKDNGGDDPDHALKKHRDAHKAPVSIVTRSPDLRVPAAAKTTNGLVDPIPTTTTPPTKRIGAQHDVHQRKPADTTPRIFISSAFTASSDVKVASTISVTTSDSMPSGMSLPQLSTTTSHFEPEIHTDTTVIASTPTKQRNDDASSRSTTTSSEKYIGTTTSLVLTKTIPHVTFSTEPDGKIALGSRAIGTPLGDRVMSSTICTGHDRYVRFEGDSVFKIQGDSAKEDAVATYIIEHKMDPTNTRFGLWQKIREDVFVQWQKTPVRATITKDEIKRFAPGATPRLDTYDVRVCPYQGKDLERLLDINGTCRSCVSDVPNGAMRLAAEHVPRFIKHLLESVHILDKAGIRHNDLRLANILINPTSEESKEGVIRTSLPRIIDFGESTFSTVSNASDIVGLFTTCKHGLRWRDVSEDEPSWLVLATLGSSVHVDKFNQLRPEQKSSIAEMLAWV